LRWLADENFNNDILRAIRRRRPGIEIIRAQDAGLTGFSDQDLLEWAAENGRVLLTHDISTLIGFACRRVERGERMCGVFALRDRIPMRLAVEEILLVDDCSSLDDWQGQICFIPLN
jgi:hypothetical protein